MFQPQQVVLTKGDLLPLHPDHTKLEHVIERVNAISSILLQSQLVRNPAPNVIKANLVAKLPGRLLVISVPETVYEDYDSRRDRIIIQRGFAE